MNQVIEAFRCFRCFQWVTQRENMYAGVGLVRLGSWSLAAVRETMVIILVLLR